MTLPTADHHENQPRCSHTEPAVKVHPKSEEGRFQDVHLGHQREPDQHFPTGWAAN